MSGYFRLEKQGLLACFDPALTFIHAPDFFSAVNFLLL